MLELDTDLIAPGAWTIIRLPSENAKLVQLKPESTIELGKFGSFKANDIIGQPYGLSFEIYDRGSVRIVDASKTEEMLAELENASENASNKDLLDDPNSQKLSYEEIIQMKREEIDGQKIVETLIQNSATFDSKTEYSKAKYLKKKKSKFTKIFYPMRTDTRTVADFFFGWNPQKVMDLRIDTLASMLTCTNVHANSRILVVDETNGLLTGAVMERLGGFGTIVSLHDGDNRNYDIIRYMNFPSRIQKTMYALPIRRIEPQPDEQTIDEPPNLEGMSEKDASYRTKFAVTAAAKVAQYRQARNILRQGNFDALLVASSIPSTSILRKLHPYISGGRPFAFFSPYRESLAESFLEIRSERLAVNLHLSDGWLRAYQVLKNRTHPEMNTSASGGFVLWGTVTIEADRTLPSFTPESGPLWYQNRKAGLREKDSSLETDEIDGISKNDMKPEGDSAMDIS